MVKRLLVCFPHPDDESFGSGSLFAKYAAEGVECTLICATNGDVGAMSADLLQKHGSAGAARLAELRCATDIIGFKEVITFGYRDSGMVNSPDNMHPDSLWQAP